jgi:predicted O-methyltransferase YrrM
MERALQRVFTDLLDTRAGRQAVGYAARRRPDLLLDAVGYQLGKASFEDNTIWPATVTRFEDVAPIVLSSNAANRGVSAMSLIEVAHLWRLADAAGPATLIEVGRERGGSTFVLAAAMHPDATLYSYDPHTKHPTQGQTFDDELADVFRKYGLRNRVHIEQIDAHVADLPEGGYALVLLDGDPSLEGTRTDFDRFCRRLIAGGNVLLHDAAADGPRRATLRPLIEEIEQDDGFERRPDVGTFVQFTAR